MSIEASLAALLQGEVDKRVAAIQAAADQAVAAFRQLAERLAQGQPFAVPQVAMVSPLTGETVTLRLPPEPPVSSIVGIPAGTALSSELAEALAGLSGTINRDNAAIADNMRV